ncbi:hypothetical protein XENORESO_014636, partial [Xenotaenia resolanae]
GSLCQQGGASGCHTGLRCVCDHTGWSVAGAQFRHISVPRPGPCVSSTGHTDACRGCVLAALCVLHAARHPGGLARRESSDCGRQRNLPSHQQTNEGCG